MRTGRWENHLEGSSRGLWDRLEAGPEEKAINVRGDSNLLAERLTGVGAPGAGAVREKRGPCMPNPLSHASPQDRDRSLASLPLQPNNHTGTRLGASHHTLVTPGPQPRRQSKKPHRNRNGALSLWAAPSQPLKTHHFQTQGSPQLSSPDPSPWGLHHPHPNSQAQARAIARAY